MNHCGRALHFVECVTCVAFLSNCNLVNFSLSCKFNLNSNSGIERDPFLWISFHLFLWISFHLFYPTMATKHTASNDIHVLVPVILFSLFEKVVQDLNMQLLPFKSIYPVHVFGVDKIFLCF